MKLKLALSFDDVLLKPRNSKVKSRKDVDTSTRISKHLTLGIPIISSCMDSVTGVEMAVAMWKAGGLGILHRYNTIEQQVKMLQDVKKNNANCAVAIGATDDFIKRASALIENGCNVLCIDVAHGDNLYVIKAVSEIRQLFPNITLIAGNVATGKGCRRLIDAGADAVRVGISCGGACSTAVVSGSGLPALQSIMDCAKYLNKKGYKDFCLLGDGGVKNSGDIVKALAAGANAVILGQLLAGTDESPGEIMEKNNKMFKIYRGMSSFAAQAEWRPQKMKEIVPEGEETAVPYRGSVNDVLFNLVGGIRSGFSYSGAFNVEDLKRKARFVRMSSAGFIESRPHAKKD